MSLSTLRREEHQAMPWNNGGGITYELAREPSGPRLAEFDWRVSVAEIAAGGPFSAFPGVDRIILLVEGESMALTVDGVSHRLVRHQPFAFDGGSSTTCAVPAPTRDLNVMTRRGRAAATVDVLAPAGRVTLPPASPLLLVGLTGSVEVSAPDGTRVELRALDAVRWDRPESLAVTGDGTVAAVHISSADGG